MKDVPSQKNGPLITGWSHTGFMRKTNLDVAQLIEHVALGAVNDAGLDFSEIDQIFIGHYNGGLIRQSFTAPLVTHAASEFRFKPVTRVENACATGSAAVYQGANAILAGQAQNVLIIGVEKMSEVSGREIGDILLRAAFLPEEENTPAGFAGVFSNIAKNYIKAYGDVSLPLARIASKNHANGEKNPYAQFRSALSVEFCAEPSEENPYVCEPLRRTDCSPVSDGAAALVLSSSELGQSSKRSVRFRAMAHTTDYHAMSRRSQTSFEGAAQAWSQALSIANIELTDLSLVETHDCFTIAELLQYEAMGLTGTGKGREAIDEGWTARGGKLPVNLSGGLKSKGHPIGATGVSMHIMAAMQLVEEAGDMQIEAPSLAGVFNMGGVAVANYCSILEAV